MTPDEAAIRAAHDGCVLEYCVIYDTEPCHAATLITLLDAALARAKALAEALEDLAEGAYFVRNDATAAMLDRARAALAAHEALAAHDKAQR